MFDKFGEFDSAEELNAAADGLLNEGDLESLKELAKENGIEEEDVQDYVDGFVENLVSITSAAFGRLYVEEQQAKTNKGEEMVARVLFTMTRSLCSKENFCIAVMHKDKRLMKVYEAMRNEAQKHKSGNVGVSCGTDRELCNLITAYYMQSEEELKKQIEKLYE